MIRWHWSFRELPDFAGVGQLQDSPGKLLQTALRAYAKADTGVLRKLYFEPQGFLSEGQICARVMQLGAAYFERLEEIREWYGVEELIMYLTDHACQVLGSPPGDYDVYVIAGLDTASIYSVEYAGSPVTVLCLESVLGDPPKLGVLLSHECHHWARRAALARDVFGDCTGERLVTEGAAVSFSEMLSPGRTIAECCLVPPETVRWTLDNRSRLERAIGERLDTTEDMNRLFSRRSRPDLLRGMPARTGYVLGYTIVQQFIRQTGSTPVDLVSIPWQEVLSDDRWGQTWSMNGDDGR